MNEIRNRSCVLEVFKCLNGLAPKAFQDYFKRVSHTKYFGLFPCIYNVSQFIQVATGKLPVKVRFITVVILLL